MKEIRKVSESQIKELELIFDYFIGLIRNNHSCSFKVFYFEGRPNISYTLSLDLLPDETNKE